MENSKKKGGPELSRRNFLRGLAATGALAAAGSLGADAKEKRTDGWTQLTENVSSLIPKLEDIALEGSDNLREIPANKHVLFLTTHLTDMDVPISIAALAKEGVHNLKVAELSTHSDVFKNTPAYFVRLASGADNSFPITHAFGSKGEHTVFEPKDFEPMKDALAAGTPIVMAGYFNLKKQYKEKKEELPEKGGYGGVYLAQITPETVIVPIAVDKHGAQARVRIGKAIEPQHIEGIERFAGIIAKGKGDEQLTDEERQEFHRIRLALKAQSDRVMESLSEMLPENKRAQ